MSPGEISDDFYALFHWLSLALATPVVFFSAQPFFRNAWRDLRTGILGMDVPVSLAIGGAYLASSYVVLLGEGEVYFDSVAMFTFFCRSGATWKAAPGAAAAIAAMRSAACCPFRPRGWKRMAANASCPPANSPQARA